MTPLTVTEAVRSFSEIVNRAVYRGETFLLHRGGKPVARLLPASDRPVPTAGDLARRWTAIPHLDPEDAEEMACDLAEGRAFLPPEEATPWD